jgi:hypothetical protein
MSEKTVVSIHWSFWVIGLVGLIFNLMGCMNYISQMNAENVATMPDAYRALIESRPAWGTGAFSISVFGGSLGGILLLLRKSVSFSVFVVALIGVVAAQVPVLGMADFPTAVWIGWLSQFVVGAFLIWYSRLATSKGWIT